LTKLQSFFVTSPDANDKKAISQSLLEIASNDESIQIRESALDMTGNIIDNCIQFYNHPTLHPGARLGLSIISGHAVPCLIKLAETKGDQEKELRRKAFWILQKIAPLALDDALLAFFVRSLNEKNANIRMAVISAFEGIVRLCDDATKKRIAQAALAPLCQALNDSRIWINAARTLGDLGSYAIDAVECLYQKLDDEDGEWAASALRNITGAGYGNKEKTKWEQWIQENKNK